jgi:hypothetical protein
MQTTIIDESEKKEEVKPPIPNTVDSLSHNSENNIPEKRAVGGLLTNSTTDFIMPDEPLHPVVKQ